MQSEYKCRASQPLLDWVPLHCCEISWEQLPPVFFFFLVTLWTHSPASIGMWLLIRDPLAMLLPESQAGSSALSLHLLVTRSKAQLVESGLQQ